MLDAREIGIDARIRQVLLQDWDPTNAARSEAAAGTYDAYIAPLRALLESGADEEAVMAWLREREQETMCFPSIGVERLRRPARKLIAIASANS